MSRLVVGLVALVANVVFAAVPVFTPVQGYLTDAAGTPTNGTVAIRFALYASAATTTPVWSETQNVQVVAGSFTASLGQGTALPLTLFRDNPATWLGITVGSDPEMTPRFHLQSTPYALQSAFADDASQLNGLSSGDFARAAPGPGLRAQNGGLAVDTSVMQSRVTGTCAPGSAMRSVAVDGTVSCQSVQSADVTNSNGSGAGDVCVRVGTSAADSTVNAGAKLFSVGTGVGASYAEKAYVDKSGNFALQGGLSVGGAANSLISSNGSAVDLGNNGAMPARASYLIGSAPATAFYASTGGAFSASTTARLWSETLGAGASDVLVKSGAYIPDTAVNAGAKLLSLRTGLGSSEVEQFYFSKNKFGIGLNYTIDIRGRHVDDFPCWGQLLPNQRRSRHQLLGRAGLRAAEWARRPVGN